MTDDIVQLVLFHSEYEANLAKSALECEGIQAMILSDDAGGMQPQFQYIRGVRLMVHEEDLERAREIIGGLESGS